MQLIGLVFVLLAVSFVGIQAQSLPSGYTNCYEGYNYYWRAGTYYVNKRSQYNCQYNYVESSEYNTKITRLYFENVQISCNGLNNLVIVDAHNSRYDYCVLNSPSNFVFGAFNSPDIIIIKKGIVKFRFRLGFESTNVVVTTAAPNTLPPVTFPPVTVAPVTFPPVTIAPVTFPPVTIAPITFPPVTVAPVSSCGVAAPQYQPNESGLTRIVGGFEANQHSWPWQALITDNNFICGASLINNQWLVTAAHCNFQLSSFQAFLGDHYIYTGSTRIRVERFIPHPSYTSDESNDIALIKLATPVTFTDTIKPLCLPNGRVETTGKTGIVTGWGTTSEGGNTANGLRQVSISVLDSTLCSRETYFNSLLSVCAGETTPSIHDSCQGDSGGPFVMKDSATNSFYLAGVVSSGVGCRGKGIYVKVSAFESWIASTMASN